MQRLGTALDLNIILSTTYPPQPILITPDATPLSAPTMNRFFSKAHLRSLFTRESIKQQFHVSARVIKGVFFLHLFWEHFYCIGFTYGASMLPTVNILGDMILVSMLHSRGRGVEVGDMVSYVHPIDGHSTHAVKRIIGMPGDFVVVDPMGAPEEMIQVPEGHCWTTGDNLPWSKDSRFYGPVPLALIRGKVIARLWPSSKWFENALKPVEG